jgi:hypothetical protein
MTPFRVTLAMVLVMVAVLLAAGCVGEQVVEQKNAPDNVTQVYRTTAILRTTPVPNASALAAAKNKPTTWMDREMGIGNFTKQLGFYNKNMNWELSQTQVEEYAKKMETGVLKKYITNPKYPEALDIPVARQYYLEVGEALGYTKEESEDFVRAIEEYRRQEFGMLDCPSWETCSPPKPIAINFSVKPRLHDDGNTSKPANTPKPSPVPITIIFGACFVVSIHVLWIRKKDNQRRFQ